ncbi:hypothetical protein C8R47DRAFT_1073309 [Mycena vitilis]|nr:hypothetical protein C8R47DRAFT_1073309 [Mycena vitilis]
MPSEIQLAVAALVFPWLLTVTRSNLPTSNWYKPVQALRFECISLMSIRPGQADQGHVRTDMAWSTNFEFSDRCGPTSVQWPECPIYWSLDPSGVQQLDMEEARLLGFPQIQLTTIVQGYSWDTIAYSALHRFHWQKGFDPISRDVAKL